VKSSVLAKRIAELTLTKKAADVIIMDLRELTTVSDYFVLCSADSDVQVRAIADAVEDGMKMKGEAVWHRESGSANWILLDFVDVVLHVFHKNTRSFYNLEKLWGDADIKHVEDKPTPVKRASPTKKKKTTRKRSTAS
jgi:ribosome-associated protein